MAFSMIPRLMLLGWVPPPEPSIADEFSYILGAQTFALGRITNPVHPFWQHFESFHINMVPSYQTMYAPAPSLFLALGIVVGHHPWWGVWLSCGLMCGAICWALQPLIRPKYALAAGIFCGLKYGLFTQYGDSYWGGAVSALGAALTLGAVVRLMRTSRPIYIPVLAAGVALLANSRPYEGFLFAVPVMLVLLVWIVRTRSYLRVLAPTLAAGIIVAGATAWYNYRGTGHATEMPYVANYQQYHFVRPFFGMGMSPMPHYRHHEMAVLYAKWEGEPGVLAETSKGVRHLTAKKFSYYYKEHFAPLLLLCIVGLWYCFRAGRQLLLTSTFLLVGLGLFAVVWWPLSSYPAPLLVSFFGLAFLGLRYLRTWRFRGRRAGLYWGRGLLVALLLFSLFTYRKHFQMAKRSEWAYPVPWNIKRQVVIGDLEKRGGQHLLLVKYGSSHVAHQEWVYNSPDIDSQSVVIAHSMGNAEDCQLMSYYPRRKVWFLYPDEGTWPELVAVDPSAFSCSDEPDWVPSSVSLARAELPRKKTQEFRK
jgi:hypothetical protein